MSNNIIRFEVRLLEDLIVPFESASEVFDEDVEVNLATPFMGLSLQGGCEIGEMDADAIASVIEEDVNVLDTPIRGRVSITSLRVTRLNWSGVGSGSGWDGLCDLLRLSTGHMVARAVYEDGSIEQVEVHDGSLSVRPA
jgi:hypothetical protein